MNYQHVREVPTVDEVPDFIPKPRDDDAECQATDTCSASQRGDSSYQSSQGSPVEPLEPLHELLIEVDRIPVAINPPADLCSVGVRGGIRHVVAVAVEHRID